MSNYQDIMTECDAYGGEKYIPESVKRKRKQIENEIASYGDPYIEQAIIDNRY